MAHRILRVEELENHTLEEQVSVRLNSEQGFCLIVV